MKLEDLTQEELDTILHERREWMDRYSSLYINIAPHMKLLSRFFPGGIPELLKSWAEEADKTYND